MHNPSGFIINDPGNISQYYIILVRPYKYRLIDGEKNDAIMTSVNCQKRRLMQSCQARKRSYLTCLMSIFGQFCQSAQHSLEEKKKSFLLSLSPLHTVVSGVLFKNPSHSIYSQETQIPGLRECVGVIIPSPCTLNRTFIGT